MGKFTVSVFINSSQQGVFDFLSNAGNFQRWMPHMQSAMWTSRGEPGVSTTGRGVMKMAGREMELMLEITRWDAPGLLGFRILNVPFPLEATEYVYRLEPKDGGTRLTLDGEIEMVRFLRFATVAFAFVAIVDFLITIIPGANPSGWVFVVVDLLFVIAFFVIGRANMSTSLLKSAS